MPELKLEILKNANRIFSKYEVYSIFVDSYINKKIKNLTEDRMFNKIVTKKYGNNNFDQQLHQAIKIFNWRCSW